jgi:hypothetical protein
MFLGNQRSHQITDSEIGINPSDIHYRGGSNLTRSFREPPKSVA